MNILVLCTGNSARSIILETLLNDLGQGDIEAYSAGSKPTGQVNPNTIRILDRKNHDLRDARSKSWDEYAEPSAPEMDIVITVCGNARDEECPYWPGAPLQVHWGVEDPAAATGSQDQIEAAFEVAYGKLRKRAEAFLDAYLLTRSKEEMAKLLSSVGKLN